MGRSLRPHGVGPALLAVTILVCACSLRGAGRNLGRGAVQGVQETRGDLGNAVGSVIDTAVFRAGRAFEDSLRPRLDSTAAALLSLLEERVGTLQGELAAYVSRDLNRALVAFIASLWIGHRKSQRSLEVVATAIRDLGSENLKDEIK
ncbi:MAG: hypothetical protein HY702_05780, partial [Gemmatimonadetes bacterium]|nr:hypothetical protein [Gemmatimonadota bacterium]